MGQTVASNDQKQTSIQTQSAIHWRFADGTAEFVLSVDRCLRRWPGTKNKFITQPITKEQSCFDYNKGNFRISYCGMYSDFILVSLIGLDQQKFLLYHQLLFDAFRLETKKITLFRIDKHRSISVKGYISVQNMIIVHKIHFNTFFNCRELMVPVSVNHCTGS